MSEPREITESFRLERVLKSSRSAIVFQAVDPSSGNPVAIKLIPQGSKAEPRQCQERFLAAMKSLQAHQPPCFPRLLDHGFTPDGSAFMVMEFVAGTRLDALTGATPTRLLRLLGEAAEGLDALAEDGISHGNLAPENLLMTRRGGEEHVTVLGFGTTSFQIGSLAGASLALEGPPQFAAPERLEPLTATVRPDARSDIYSLALSACALLDAQAVPVDAPAPSVTLSAALMQKIHDPVRLRSALEHALRRNASERLASLAEFRDACLANAGEVSAAPQKTGAVPASALEEPFAAAPPPPERPHVSAPPQVLPAAPHPAASPVPHPAVAEGSFGFASSAGLPQPPPPAAAAVPFRPAPQPPAPAPQPPATRERVRTGPVPVHRLAEMPPPPELQPPEPLPFGPETAPEGAATTQPIPTTLPPARVARRRSGSRFLLWGGIGLAVLAAVAVAAFFVARQSGFSQRAAASPTPVRVRPTPIPKAAAPSRAVTALQTAEAALALGDLTAAGEALRSITPTDLDTLSVGDRERYDTLRATHRARAERAFAKDLTTHLASGNLKALAETVQALSPEDEQEYARNADISTALDEARRAIAVQALMLKAQKQSEWAVVLQQSTTLVSLVPRNAQATELRDRAAGILEREATDFAARGNYDLAMNRLDTVRKSWPNRTGLASRIERLKAEQAADQKLASVLVAVDQAERDKVPERGLELLAGTTPNGRYEARFQQARARLAAQLQQLDSAAPTVALTPGTKLEYKKGEPGTINVRITDDHAVKSARLFARVEGSVQFVELPLRRVSGADYAAEVSFNFHQNKTVEFYVVASDYSDHTAQLGSPKEPLKLKRKKWSLFGG